LVNRYKGALKMNIWEIIYLNCGEKYEFMIDHRSYIHNLSSCEIKAEKKFRPERDSNPWPLWYRCSALFVSIPIEGERWKWIYERSYIWSVSAPTRHSVFSPQSGVYHRIFTLEHSKSVYYRFHLIQFSPWHNGHKFLSAQLKKTISSHLDWTSLVNN